MSALFVPAFLSGLLGFPFKEAAKVGLSAVSGWIIVGAEAMLTEVIKLISLVTTPSLTASWFSPTYWRIAGLAMLLTLPFLFAAAVQAVLATDPGILVRAAFRDLPIAALAVTVTAPVIGLLLSATDEMCAVVTGGRTLAGGFLGQTVLMLPGIGDGLMPAAIAVMILLSGMVLLVELIVRAAAIYIVVLFLPLGFAAMVWPARRVWVKRMIELLVALILSKFAMVAILSLAIAGVESLTPGVSSISTALTAMALMILAACSPWALLRLLPFTEMAAAHGETASRGVRSGLREGRDALRGLLGDGTAPEADGALPPVDGSDDAVLDPDRGAVGQRSVGPLALLARTGSSAGEGSPGAGISGTANGSGSPAGGADGSGTPGGAEGSHLSSAAGPGGSAADPDRPGADPSAPASLPTEPGALDGGASVGDDGARAGGGGVFDDGVPPLDAPAAAPAAPGDLDLLPATSPAGEKGPLEDLSPIFRHGSGLAELNLDPELPGGLGALAEPDSPADAEPDAEADR